MLKLKLQYLAIWCEKLTHLKRPWCWERLKAGGEGDNRGWDGWMASPTRWAWVWVNSRSWWWTGRPGVLQSLGLQRVRHNWATELNRKGKTRDLFKKIRDTKGTFHARMGTIKDRNDIDLTEAEDIKKRWQEYTEELYKKIFKTQITTMVWSLT